MTLIFLTLAWVLGLVSAEALGLSRGAVAYLIAGAVVSGLVAWRVHSLRQTAAVLAAACLGCARCVLAQPLMGDASVGHYNGSSVRLTGWVAAPPDERATSARLTVEALWVEDAGSGARRPCTGRLLLTVPTAPEYAYGDEVIVEGRLEEPPVLEDFDYRLYLARRGIQSVAYRADVTRLGVRPGPVVAVRRAAEGLRLGLRRRIEAILPEPEAGLLSGILLGYDHTLAGEVDEAFRRSGLTHVIVISGSNIALVMQILLLGGRMLGRRRALWLAAGGALAYALFVGWAPPVARAGLMGAIYAGAPLSGRRNHGPTSLAAATLIMTALAPMDLWGASFQLSFAATCGLLLLEPALARALRSWAERSGQRRRMALARVLRETVLMTLVAQVVTFPVLWYHFQEASPLALLANLLALPVQAVIIPLGAVALAGASVSLALGRVLAWGVWLPLRWTAQVSETVGGLSGADLQMPPLSLGGAAGLYVLLGIAAAALAGRGAPRRAPRERVRALASATGASPARWEPPTWLLGALGGCCILVWMAAYAVPDGRLHFYALDIGQGDALLILTPGGRTVLVDGGPDPLLHQTRLGRTLPFWQRRVDLVVATHSDADHLTGLLDVMERYAVGAALEAPAMGEGDLTARWHAAVEARRVPLLLATAGTEVQIGNDLVLRVLHPSAEAARRLDDNAGSVVMRLTYGAFSALLTADADGEAETALLASEEPLEAVVLKVAHHGAAAGTTAAFLEAARPQEAVISVGSENRFGHPAPEVLARLADAGVRVWRTDECGTVECVTDGERWWVRCR